MQAFGLVLFGFVCGICFMGSVGFSLMYRAGQRKANRERMIREAREAWLRG